MFGYIALLNIGVAAVVLRKRWDHLLLLAAIGTVFMELLWVDSFFHVPKAALAFAIFLGFELQFLLVYFLRRRNAAPARWAAWAAAICGFASLGFAAYILGDYPGLSRSPVSLFGFIFAADLGLVVLAIGSGLLLIAEIAGIAVFGLLAGWTAAYLDAALLWYRTGKLRFVRSVARRCAGLEKTGVGRQTGLAAAKFSSASSSRSDLVVRLARSKFSRSLAERFCH